MRPWLSLPAALLRTPARRALFALVIGGVAVAGALGTPACSGPAKTGKHPESQARVLSLILTTELQGTLEPCGCTADPLGDLARTAALIKGLRAERPVLFLDAGSTLYTENPPTPLRADEELAKAGVLAAVLPELGLAAQGLGPYDLVRGVEGVRLPRQAANVVVAESTAAGALPLEAPRVLEVGGVKVGVFGVVDPALVRPFGVEASDPAAAAQGAIAQLRKDGAALIVGLAQLSPRDARKLAQAAPGADVLVVGAGVPELGLAAPEQVGDTWLVTPGTKGQVLARVDVDLGRPGQPRRPLVDAIGASRAQARIAELTAARATLDERLVRWSADATADRAFVDGKRAERDAMTAELEALERTPLRKPDDGPWFTLELVSIKKGLACDPALVARKTALDRTIGEANRAAAASEPPVEVPAGAATYVGAEECGYCHKPAVDFWKTTRHATAFATLEKVGKEWSRDCIACHVTGWREPGGATLAKTEGLKDVQCETCHGPGSIHVAADGKEKPSALVRLPKEARCAQACHTPEHSDTFAFDAYLRDVTGPGHGATFRTALGDGPTGHALRAAALAKAGAAIGAGCVK